jgi:hypothetical protein
MNLREALFDIINIKTKKKVNQWPPELELNKIKIAWIITKKSAQKKISPYQYSTHFITQKTN